MHNWSGPLNWTAVMRTGGTAWWWTMRELLCLRRHVRTTQYPSSPPRLMVITLMPAKRPSVFSTRRAQTTLPPTIRSRSVRQRAVVPHGYALNERM